MRQRGKLPRAARTAVPRRRGGLLAIGLSALLLLTTGCFGLDDDADGSTSSTSTLPVGSTPPSIDPVTGDTVPPSTVAAPMTAWPAGVVWGDFADETVAADLPTSLTDSVAATATGPGGRVAVGRIRGTSGALGTVEDLSTAAIWISEGEGWTPVEVPLGNGTGALYDVAAWQGGYVAVGFHADAYERHATAVVLSSVDGRTWVVASQLPSVWSGWGSRVRITPPGAVLVEVSMAVCSDKSDFVNDPTAVTVPALWSALAPTGVYAQLPNAALAALSPLTPTPVDAAGCTADYESTAADQRAATFGTELGDIAAIGDRFAVLDPAATAVSITADLNSWTQVRLPDPVAKPLASLLYADAAGHINVVAVSERVLGAGYVAGAVDRDSWVSTVWAEDAGGTLQRISPWRPLRTQNLYSPRLELRDGNVRLVAVAVTDRPGGGFVERAAISQPTAAQGPPTCTPGPQANCNFVTIDGAQLAGADLTGIQLYAATINGSNLDGAHLNGALLARALVSGTSLVGADLTSANLLAARFDQTNLTSAILAFTDVSAATFTGSVLSGATFAGATMDSTIVDYGTACPDGVGPTPGDALVLSTACRLG